MPSFVKNISLFIALIAITALLFPSPVQADGGPIVPRDLWGEINEGQQIAVVTIQDDSTVKVDLFISILDQTQQSHDITFFIPLGKSTTGFSAIEQNLIDFDSHNTGGLDRLLRDSANAKQHAMQMLFSGALLSNGGILTPFWIPMLLSSCAAAAPKAEASFQTGSSQIGIYDINADTDIQALIATAGLAPSVQDTLSRLQGQQIAVIKMHTRVQSTSVTGQYSGSGTEPGLYLSWFSKLVSTPAGPSFTYTLGTGAAWSKPINLTRVYVVAPTFDFNASYPALGIQHSGYDYIEGSQIDKYYDVPAYAADEARGDFGKIMRLTYSQSNPTSDVVITVTPRSSWSAFRNSLLAHSFLIAFLFALILGLAFWFLSWHFLMPRFLGNKAAPRLDWYLALIYPGINFVIMIFPGSILYLFYLLGLTYGSLIVLFLMMGGVSIGIFELIHGGYLGVSRGVATRAFVLVSLVSSGAYLLFSFALSKIIGII